MLVPCWLQGDSMLKQQADATADKDIASLQEYKENKPTMS